MKRAALLLLSGIFLSLALTFPARTVDALKLQRIEALEGAQRDVARTLQPEDDSYVDYINHPYPLSGGRLFQGFLLADALLLALFALVPRGRSDAPKETCESPLSAKEVATIAGITAVAAALRLVHAQSDLWLDEITTLIRHARSPVYETFMQATSSNNHLLNSVLCHLSLSLFGESELSLRLPAILAGIATVPILYLLVRRYGSREEAILGSTLMALSYHHVFFSQDARGYSAFLLGAIGGTYYLLKALERGTAASRGAYAGFAMVCTLSLLFGVVVVAAHALCAAGFLWRRRELVAEWKPVAGLFLGVGYLTAHAYALVVPDFLGFIFGEYSRAEVGWRLSPALFAEILHGMALGPAVYPVLVAGGVLGLAGLVTLWKRDALAAALLLAPCLLMVALVLILRAAVFPRFFIIVLPVAFLLFARGVIETIDLVSRYGWMPRRPAFVIVLLCAVTVSALMLRRLYSYPKQDYSGARAYVLRHMRPGDLVVAVGTAGEGYRHYWPAAVIENRVSRLRPEVQSGKRMWLLYSFPRDMEARRPRLQRFIRENFVEMAHFRGTINDGGLRVCLSRSIRAFPR